MWSSYLGLLRFEMTGHLKRLCQKVVLEGLKLKVTQWKKILSLSLKGNIKSLRYLLCTADRSRQKTPPMSYPNLPSAPLSEQLLESGFHTSVSWPGRQVYLPTSEDLVLFLFFFTSFERGVLLGFALFSSSLFSCQLNQIFKPRDLGTCPMVQ